MLQAATGEGGFVSFAGFVLRRFVCFCWDFGKSGVICDGFCW